MGAGNAAANQRIENNSRVGALRGVATPQIGIVAVVEKDESGVGLQHVAFRGGLHADASAGG